MKYKKMETCSSVIYHLSKSIDVKDFASILTKEMGYKKTGELASNIELKKGETYVVIGKKTIVIEGDDEKNIEEIEKIIESL